jgi:hypothetical protein
MTFIAVRQGHYASIMAIGDADIDTRLTLTHQTRLLLGFCREFCVPFRPGKAHNKGRKQRNILAK